MARNGHWIKKESRHSAVVANGLAAWIPETGMHLCRLYNPACEETLRNPANAQFASRNHISCCKSCIPHSSEPDCDP